MIVVLSILCGVLVPDTTFIHIIGRDTVNSHIN